MTDNEIIKALECCMKICKDCDNCPCINNDYINVYDCKYALLKNALDLITRQQKENKRLGKEVNLVSIQFQDLQERYEEAQAEIERLKECPKCAYEYDGEVMEYCVQGPCPNFKTVEQIRSEVVKEFAERLKKRIYRGGVHPTVEDEFMCDIDNLVKEMVGENNG